MRLLLTALIALLLISTKAHAFFTIDYNEQWLRNDAYNRAMSQATARNRAGVALSGRA